MQRLGLIFFLFFLVPIYAEATALQKNKIQQEAKPKALVLKKPAMLKTDSSRVNMRTFDEKVIEQYSKQKEFIYDDAAPEKLSFWDRFWRWFWQKLGGVFGGKVSGRIIEYLLIFLGVAAIIFIAFKLAGIDLKLLSKKSKAIEVPYEESLENIHEINFDEQLNAAIQQKNYRLAVRLLYLKSLKHLSDKGLIDWQPEKTNHTYVAELKNEHHREPFINLTEQFEYIWYGEFFIDETQFTRINESFHQFNKQAI